MSIPPQIRSIDPRWGADTLLVVAWRRKAWVACGIFVGLVVSAAVGYVWPRSYQSTAQVSIVKKRPDTVTGVDTRQISAEENASPATDLLKSSVIIDRAIQSKGLDSLSIELPPDQTLTEHIRNMLTVAAGKAPTGQASSVYKLQFRGRNADDCQTVLTALLESYKEFMDRKHQAVSEDTLELIMRDKQTLEKEMAEKDVAYRAFREKAPLLGKARDGLELRQERLNSIQNKRSNLLMQRIELDGQVTALESALKQGKSQEVILAMLVEFMRKGDTAESAVQRNVTAQDQLFTLVLEERKLSEVRGPNHPEVVELRKRIEDARRLIVLPPSAWKTNGDSTTPIDPVKLHVELLKQKLHHVKVAEGLLEGVLKAEQDEARTLAVYEIQNDAFRTRIAMNQQLYEALTKRLNEVSLIRNVGGYHIELLEPPSIGKRVAPSMALALAIGALAGLGLGLALACRAESRAAISVPA